MSAQHSRLTATLRALEDLTRHHPDRDVDEYELARYLAVAPDSMPAHHYIKSPQRGKFLRVLAVLEARKFVYVTQNGFWRLHITKLGRQWLEYQESLPEPEAQTEPAVELAPEPPALPPHTADVWRGPRPSQVPPRAPTDRFTTAALGAATLAAVVIFAFGVLPQGPLAQRAAAQPETSSAVTLQVVPTLPPVTPTTPPPAATPRAYVVANTGGAGVFLRDAPQTGAAVTALPEASRLIEVSPPASVSGTQWLHVRTTSGTVGFVSAAYTVPAR